MSGETEKDVSGWTIDTLAEHLQTRINDLMAAYERRMADLETHLLERFDQQKRAVDAAFEAHEKLTNVQIAAAKTAVDAALASADTAVGKAESANEKRFESVNEFRGQLADQANLFLTRTEYQANHQSLVGRVSDITDRLNRAEGQDKGSSATIAGLLAAATVVISIVVVFINLLVR